MPAKLPAEMKIVRFDGAGGPEVIRVASAPVPTPGEGQVLIKVAAAGINRPDIIQREGRYPPPPGESDVPGLEVAGEVVGVGPGVTEPLLGGELCALLGSGGYAEYALAQARLCLPRPAALTIREAAGVPETYFTVFDNVFTRGALKAGERFLVHGGSSGIGTTAIQLAYRFGAEVFATAGSDAKCATCRTLGAAHAINYKSQDFVAEVKRLTNKAGVDLILDMVGGDYLSKNISILATEGRLVQIAFLASAIAEKVDFLPVMLRRLTLTGSTLRARSLDQKAAVADGLREIIWPLLDAGEVKPLIHATFPLEQARQAHELMESSTHVGKILLVPTP